MNSCFEIHFYPIQIYPLIHQESSVRIFDEYTLPCHRFSKERGQNNWQVQSIYCLLLNQKVLSGYQLGKMQDVEREI